MNTQVAVIENQAVVNVEINNIVKSSYNPRQKFSEEYINELSESIKGVGLIQPVTLRPVGDKFEIVCGECRFRAVLKIGATTIPAIIRELSDDEAWTFALIENIHREGIPPVEEAKAFQAVLDLKQYTVETLAENLRKPENEIKKRLKLNALIPGIAVLLDGGKIDLASGYIYAELSKEVQEHILTNHLETDNVSNDWKELGKKELISRIKNNYTANLDYYFFDKTECLTCGYNSNNQSLFSVGCGQCTNRNCLIEKNNTYMFEKALQMVEDYPQITFISGNKANSDVIQRLNLSGYEVMAYTDCNEIPEAPEAPEEKNYNAKKEYKEAVKTFKERETWYKTKLQEIGELREQGKITDFGKIVGQDIILCYVKTKEAETPIILIEKLEQKEKKNQERKQERIVEDAKVLVKKLDYSGEFTPIEENMLYYFLLSFVPDRHAKNLGSESSSLKYLANEEKKTILQGLTKEGKDLILRDFIASRLNDWNNEELLFDFLNLHQADKLKEIRDKYDEYYTKQSERLEEKKAVLEVQKKREESKKKENVKEMQVA